MSNLGSIDKLLHPDDSDESVSSKFKKKQKEIKLKEIERRTAREASESGLDYIDLNGFPISPEALSLLSEDEAIDLKAICFFYNGSNIRLGCLNKTKEVEKKLKELEDEYHAKGRLYLISKTSFDIGMEAYKRLPKVKKYQGGVEIKAEDLEKFKKSISSYKNLNEKINEVNISDVITLIIATALKLKASDVHVEAENKEVVVRLRLDGVLQDAAEIEKEKWERVVSRLKILAEVKINISDKPQDGRFTIHHGTRTIDVRASFLPTAYGESVVMRILDSHTASLEFEELGLREEVLPILKKEIDKPNGLILTTGPTGSGKTTTLYSILNKLNKPGEKIITLEDPIEYQLKGINQSQIDESGGYSFSDGLRSIMRQDPDIVMVGEIRDLETAEIAVQASLTGHIVLSTLHTNDAAGVIPRLTDLGVKPYFLVPSINAVIGQRLVRKLCPHCQKKHKLSEEEKEKVNKILAVISPKANLSIPSELPQLYKAGDGCEKCGFIGYKDRIGIYEIFTMNDKIKQLTIDSAPSFKILQQAIEDGMITMLQDGVLKAIDGVTSLEEIYRVIGKFDYIDELYDIVISQTIGRGIKIDKEQVKESEELTADIKDIPEKLKHTPSDKLLPLVLSIGVSSEAGDIHIEPTENEVKVRFRIDGVMHEIMNLPKSSYLPILSEIKILAGEDTNVKKASFDGRFRIYLPNRKIDCRVSIISGGFGETIVIRLLANSAANLKMEELGITGVTNTSLQKAMDKTKGIIITTGPTGSGKTTTLYSMLNELNQSDVKIITVEDPIEYQLPGIMQTQIDEKNGYTFVSAMRSLLRQNPNIMMIGEIRDSETAKIAIEAALTGHLVLSTIHANSASAAVSRFAGLGLERQALANSIEFAIGQRLVRKLCPHCKKIKKSTEEEEKKVNEVLSSIKNPNVKIPKDLIFYESSGCEKCSQIGYKGRIGLYESIEMLPNIKKLIQQEHITDYEIEELAIENGTVTMLQDGVLKALNGDTSLEEVFRVL
ncbi:MAG: GspE/PulE family protein [Patescibacteria group bacterium]|jgi:type II secretory ATPase GspE/PulE/Tfp pilus assembly ATPase PilB-like protein|nr:GspE/PulE family protein [Patescibacteria group bacterium]